MSTAANTPLPTQQVQVKLCITPQNVSRRFAIPNDLSLHDFLIQIGPFISGNVIKELQYIDDEKDLISVNSEREWRNGLYQHRDSLLRIRVTTNAVCKKAVRPYVIAKCFIVLALMVTHPLLCLLMIAGVLVHSRCNPNGKLKRTEHLLKEKAFAIASIFIARIIYDIEAKYVIPFLLVVIPLQVLYRYHKTQKQANQLCQNVQTTKHDARHYATHLTTLDALGFKNSNLNLHLLNTYNGDVTHVINILLQHRL
jgi:hypothetical protein